MEWVKTDVDLKEVVQDAVASIQQLIQDRNIKIELQLDAGAPPVMGDRDRLVQVIVNLISSAVKFCEQNKGHIRVGLKVRQDCLQVDIADNGIGIKPEDQPKIFEKFRQIKDPTRGRPFGTGIGLTISKHIIDFHQGRIWVESEPGQGATFSFTLPVSRRGPAAD